MRWSRSVAAAPNDERGRYARIQAAARGDREARDAIVAEARPALIRRLQREMKAAHRDAAETVIAPVVEQACRVAFETISEKPANWSMYGWLAWHVEREARDVDWEGRGPHAGASLLHDEPEGDSSS
jgi:hypothetical protein